jgi:putative transposase
MHGYLGIRWASTPTLRAAGIHVGWAYSPTFLLQYSLIVLQIPDMPNYARAFKPGGTFFLTLVTEKRAPIFADAIARPLLHAALNNCRRFHPFILDAIVLLPDHLHMLITLPNGDSDFSIRVTNIKSAFTRTYLAAGGKEQFRSASRLRQRNRGIWQKRFWEHTIRAADDLRRHFDYIHYNPVKHGYARCPHAWFDSSFQRFVVEGLYEADWCCQCKRNFLPPTNLDEIAASAGE